MISIFEIEPRNFCMNGKARTCADRGIVHALWCDGCRQEFADFYAISPANTEELRQVYSLMIAYLNYNKATAEDSPSQILHFIEELAMNWPIGIKCRVRQRGSWITLMSQGPPNMPVLEWYITDEALKLW